MPHDDALDPLPLAPLPAAALRWRCDPAGLGFETTAELPELDEPLGQDRAVEAIRFAVGVRHAGYNLFALGPSGVGKHYVVERHLAQQSECCPVPDDWCYVHPMGQGDQPVALRVAAGRGPGLRQDMADLLVDLRAALTASFEGDTFAAQQAQLVSAAEAAEAEIFAQVDSLAAELQLAVDRSPNGVTLSPLIEGEPIPTEGFDALTTAEKKQIEARLEALQEPVREALRHLPALRKRASQASIALRREASAQAIAPVFAELAARWEHAEVLAWLSRVEQDVAANSQHFLEEEDQSGGESLPAALIQTVDEDGWEDMRRYRVNVLVSHVGAQAAPVVREDDPTLGNLFGRIEHIARFGSMSTDFTRIRPGALHRANGGFLVLDARRLLEDPPTWEHLKRALRQGEIRMPTPSLSDGVATTLTLNPAPIPLQVKVVLVGERELYYLLSQLDPQFDRLFKVSADFGDDMPRDAEHTAGLARLMASLNRECGLRDLDAPAMARVLEHAVRLAGDRDRLTTHVDRLADLLREADHLAGRAGLETVGLVEVDGALAARRAREGRLEKLALRSILEGSVRVPTDGVELGEINGLAVFQVGRSSFGLPVRLGVRVRLGDGEVIDIEREVELGGPLHSKGVQLLEGFLGGRFGASSPLSFTATIAFEQSYGEVDGDSASLAETCVLLSALAELPVRQDLAVTGSVDQRGRAQAVGGVTDKIEGWFDLCAARGLTGTQGVIIPRSNLRALQLRPEIVCAAEEGRFAVHAVATVDHAMALLTGHAAGERTRDGWTEGSVNARVAARLAHLAVLARQVRCD